MEHHNGDRDTIPPSDDEGEDQLAPKLAPKPKRPTRTYGRHNRAPSPDIDNPPQTIALLRMKDYSNVGKIAERDHLTDDNWHEWKERMKRVLTNCDITGYADGTIVKPLVFDDPVGASNWVKNDAWAQQVIIQNVTSSQMNHVGSKFTAQGMYSALVDTHDSTAHQTVTHIQALLYETRAGETDDILKHLDTLKSYRDRLNKFANTEFHIYDTRFKSIITNSLPASWKTYVEPYNGNANDPKDPDPKRRITSDAFIGLLREEYRIRVNRSNNGNRGNANGSTNLVTNQTNAGPSKSLKARIDDTKSRQSPYCDHCKSAGHWTSRCRKNPANKCYNCGKIGHRAKDCWGKKKENEKGKRKGKEKEKSGDQTNMVDEEITFVSDGEAYNFDTYEMYNVNANDERLIYYDWLADNATTSHVSCQREVFTSYTPLGNTSVTGVSGKEAVIAGKGTVELVSTCNNQEYLLRLENVLHVPGQRNNLISLGRWDAAGGRYIGGKGELTLVTKDGKHVAHGKKMDKHLYKMNVSAKNAIHTSRDNEAFNSQGTIPSWETWHKHYGHVGYSGLQKILDGNMVEGFTVDDQTDKPDCVACTEAKQHVESFPKTTNRQTEPGELTHIDLWGKYAVKSIHGNQYYLLFVDDAKRYITANCLKEKSDAAQGVIDYLTHLTTQGRKPKAIQIDGGKEFVNETLKGWCRARGIEIHMTAPYSPSQNGVAERMNRTLVELSRTMLRAQDLPEFLWEYALLYAVYVRNRSFTTYLGNSTPHEGWFKHKPSVSHLREFGAPVWILLQGQKEDRKMLPKSKRQVYVGFDDGAKAVKYYNAETRKILTSHNFRHINPPPATPPEPIIIAPSEQPEGESGSLRKDMPLPGANDPEGNNQDQPNKRKRKRREDDPVVTNEPRKTQGIRTDYKQLNEKGN